MAVRATRTASLGACSERFIHDLPDGPRTAAALSAAAEAAIHLTGGSRQIFRGGHCAADVVVGQDVTRTNDHGVRQAHRSDWPHRYVRPALDAKGKQAFSSYSKLRFETPRTWNNSNEPLLSREDVR